MRVFYIFKIKEYFRQLYNDSPSTLFNIFKQIYYLTPNELEYAKTLLNQLVDCIDKNDIDTKLFIKLHKEVPYSKRGNVHYINNMYKEEISRLIVSKSYIKIESEKNFSSFFNELLEIDKAFFVCDFEYTDFFFLDRTKSLV